MAQSLNCVVTGAGSGLGRAVTHALLGAGHRVVLAGRRDDALEETAAGAGGASLCVQTDVTKPVAVDHLFASARTFGGGRVDVLFNNAGAFGTPAPVQDVRHEDFAAVVAVNLTGAFLCAQAAYRAMLAQSPRGGRIINVGSVSAHVPRPQAVAYTTTKHAITGLTRQLALEGREHDIACGQIDIGNASTPMTAAIEAGALQPDGSKQPEATMAASDIGATVVWMVGLPLEANALFTTVMANRMPFAGRG